MDDVDTRLRRIALDGIQDHSAWLKLSARSILHYVKLLVSRPEYETMAEGEMDEAEKVLVETLESLRKAKANFKKLPIDGRKT